MEAGAINILQYIISKAGLEMNISLLLCIIGLLMLSNRFLFQPMLKRIQTIPTEEMLKDTIEKSLQNNNQHLTDIVKRLDEMCSTLERFETAGNYNTKELENLKEDIGYMKDILVQFQGHLMYSKQNNHFGNKELR